MCLCVCINRDLILHACVHLPLSTVYFYKIYPVLIKRNFKTLSFTTTYNRIHLYPCDILIDIHIFVDASAEANT